MPADIDCKRIEDYYTYLCSDEDDFNKQISSSPAFTEAEQDQICGGLHDVGKLCLDAMF
jgi:hypothetical protein